MTRHHILAEWMPPQGGPEKSIFCDTPETELV